MGTIRQVIEDQPNYKIVQFGGPVHYSPEFYAYLSRQPTDIASRIVAEIEYQAQPRRVIEYNPRPVAVAFFFSEGRPR